MLNVLRHSLDRLRLDLEFDDCSQLTGDQLSFKVDIGRR
jgi:hypothetical protein